VLVKARARDRGLAGPPESALPPLRWIAEQDLVYEPDTHTLHRSGCPRIGDPQRTRKLPAGHALELIWAPTMCQCGPDVTLGLNGG
jgi:hypothetical protein